MASTPAFVATVNPGADLSTQRMSAANTNRDGTGTLYLIVTGGANGERVDRVQVKANSATTAGVIRLFVKDGSTNYRLIGELLVTAITPSATVKSWEGEFVRTDGQPLILLKSGWALYGSTHNGESFDMVATVSGTL